MSAKGGITKGKSHAEGGIPMTVKSTGQKVELEGGEGVINKRSMSDKTLHEFEGKKLTKCEIASKINSDKNFGVKINCGDVKSKYGDGGVLHLSKYQQGGAITNYVEATNVADYQKELERFLNRSGEINSYAVDGIFDGDYEKQIDEPLEKLNNDIFSELSVYQRDMLEGIKKENKRIENKQEIMELQEVLPLIDDEKDQARIEREIRDLQKQKFSSGGQMKEKYEAYIDFMNKDKGYKTDRKYFKTYKEAEKWARNEFESFNPDMIRYTDFMQKGGGVKEGKYKVVKNWSHSIIKGFDSKKDAIDFSKKYTKEQTDKGYTDGGTLVMTDAEWRKKSIEYYGDDGKNELYSKGGKTGYVDGIGNVGYIIGIKSLGYFNEDENNSFHTKKINDAIIFYTYEEAEEELDYLENWAEEMGYIHKVAENDGIIKIIDENYSEYAKGGKTSKNKIIIELTKTKDYPVYIGSNYSGKNSYKKGQVFESEFVMQFKKDKDVILKVDGYNIPLKRDEFIVHSKKAFADGGMIDKYDNSVLNELTKTDKEIIEIVSKPKNDYTIDEKIFLQKFRGNNVANYISNEIATKIWSMFFDNQKSQNADINSIFLLNSGIGKLLSNYQLQNNKDGTMIFVDMDCGTELENIEREITKIVNRYKTLWRISTEKQAIADTNCSILVEPYINPTENMMLDPNFWDNTPQVYGMSIAEFSNAELSNRYFDRELLKSNNRMFTFKQYIINQGIKNVENITVVNFYIRNL